MITVRFMLLTNQGGDGIVFDGEREVDNDRPGPLAVMVLHDMLNEGVVIRDGDFMFFPNASPKHRGLDITEGLLRHARALGSEPATSRGEV